VSQVAAHGAGRRTRRRAWLGVNRHSGRLLVCESSGEGGRVGIGIYRTLSGEFHLALRAHRGCGFSPLDLTHLLSSRRSKGVVSGPDMTCSLLGQHGCVCVRTFWGVKCRRLCTHGPPLSFPAQKKKHFGHPPTCAPQRDLTGARVLTCNPRTQRSKIRVLRSTDTPMGTTARAGRQFGSQEFEQRSPVKPKVKPCRTHRRSPVERCARSQQSHVPCTTPELKSPQKIK
jgi:hypothetical protein